MPGDDKLFLMLGEMRSDIKNLDAKFDNSVSEVKTIKADVSEIKEWKQNIMGKVTIIGLFIGGVWTVLVLWLSKRLF